MAHARRRAGAEVAPRAPGSPRGWARSGRRRPASCVGFDRHGSVGRVEGAPSPEEAGADTSALSPQPVWHASLDTEARWSFRRAQTSAMAASGYRTRAVGQASPQVSPLVVGTVIGARHHVVRRLGHFPPLIDLTRGVPMTPTPSDAWLRRIHALLAKAESTEFPAEAETLLAKAQELMTRHAIDEAMLQASGTMDREQVVSETITVEPPYAGPRSSLLGGVARANACRLVVVESANGTQRCVLVGHLSSISRTTTLFAALTMHATRAMLSAPVPPSDTPRRFRHAFLLAFASRIGERFDEANRTARAQFEGTAASGRSLAVVLRDRSDAVDDAFAQLFPHTRIVRSRGSSSAGFRSGRAAADRAELGGSAFKGTQGRLRAG